MAPILKRILRDCVPIVGLGLLAGTGCATIEHPAPIEEVYADSLFGTWRWQSNDTFTRGPGRDGQLSLNADSTYRLTEIRNGGSRTRMGRFKVYQAARRDSLDPWIEFDPGIDRKQRVFQFSGHDTLLLRDGDLGYALENSGVDLYVRAISGSDSLPHLPDGDVVYDQRPMPLSAPPPEYPVFARTARITGRVVLDVLIDEKGHVRDVFVIQSVMGLDEPAIAAAKVWTFRPARKNGVPVAAWYELPFDFQLPEGP
jgi:TonB family protein